MNVFKAFIIFLYIIGIKAIKTVDAPGQVISSEEDGVKMFLKSNGYPWQQSSESSEDAWIHSQEGIGWDSIEHNKRKINKKANENFNKFCGETCKTSEDKCIENRPCYPNGECFPCEALENFCFESCLSISKNVYSA